MLRRLRNGALALACLAGAMFAPPAVAQDYPNRPIHFIVGFAAGGPNDIVARILGEWLSKHMGQQWVIENRAGSGGMLAAGSVINSAPDGYTVMFVAPNNAIGESLYKKLPFNFIRDTVPIAGTLRLANLMVVPPDFPAKTVAEFIAHAKANPGKVNMASFGTGTISHLAWELFKMMTGVEMVHVPYPGGAPMVTDLIAGRVQAGIDALPNSLPHIQAGTLRALAVTGPERSHALPDVPTVGETVPGYEVSGWTGIGVPAGTPAPIVATLNREINAGLADPSIKARLADVGGRPMLLSPEQFGKVWLRDTDKWAKVLTSAAAKPQ